MSEQSNFRVPVTKILEIGPHSNAHSLEIARIFDYSVVVQKGRYQVGSTVLYIPIDSILPAEVESKIFGPDSKIKLNKSRVRQIRIRGITSQGMVVGPETFSISGYDEGADLAGLLGITKYEPDTSGYTDNLPKVKKERNRSYENPYFHQYGGLTNIKWYPDMFVEGQEVVFQEKIHGSNFRAGYLPQEPKNLWQKFLKLIGKFPEFQFCYGSNNVQRQHSSKRNTSTYYGTDVYWDMVVKYDLQNKLQPGETLYAELYGPGIQKNYDYGLKDEHRLVVFDIKKLAEDKKSNQWLTVGEVEEFCKQRGLPLVPVLYRGPYSKELAKEHTLGPSKLYEGQKVREGIVIRDPKETTCYAGKKMFKLISEDYLADDTNTDNH